ncbi:MAG: hypothetical protein VB108_05960 [Anaerolineaceae bacterium]|nr:hypothetical protein [Anaerolineaceae bacterium]
MNFDPPILNPLAIFMCLFAAFMWGTWFISLKYLGDYPLEAYYLTLFATSFIFVWIAGFVLDGSALLQNLRQVWMDDKSRILITFLCGMLYVFGMMISVRVIKEIGLSLSQPLQASINLIVGTFLSALIGGIPAGLTVGRILVSAVFLGAAIFLTMRAGILKSRKTQEQEKNDGRDKKPVNMRRVIVMLIIGALFVPAYSTGLSYGLKSVTQAHGMAVMPFMTVLASGAFAGILMTCGTILTQKRQWHVFKEHGFEIHKLGVFSGLAHYGGNIIHTFATRNLSAAISWPLGITAGLWTQLWGLVYGEFKGAPKKAYFSLFAGILCYLIGAFVIASII